MGIGLRLKEILRNQKMTIKQLSEKADISINTLYSITKRDSENIDPVILQRIIDVLGISEEEFFGISPHDDQSRILSNELLSNNDPNKENNLGTDSLKVAAAFGLPNEISAILIEDFLRMGIKPEQIKKESPRAAVVGDGFIVDEVTPQEARALAEYAMQKINTIYSQTKKIVEAKEKAPDATNIQD